MNIFDSDENVYSWLNKPRQDEILRFLKHLKWVSTSFSVALNGDWGAGKTVFVRQSIKIIRALLNSKAAATSAADDPILEGMSDDEKNTLADWKCYPIYVDAWENELRSIDNPIESLLLGIIKDRSASLNNEETLSKNFLSDISASVLDSLGFKGSSVVTILVKKIGKMLSTESSEKDCLQEVFEKLKQLKEQDTEIVVFVDELDRCTPEYALRFLEMASHYFFQDRISFVWSINRNSLIQMIKKRYGTESNVTLYLDKFFDSHYDLKPLSRHDLVLKALGVGSLHNLSYYNNLEVTYLMSIAEELNLQPRTLNKWIKRVCKERGTSDSENLFVPSFTGCGKKLTNLEAVTGYFFPVLVGLRMINEEAYQLFIGGENDIFSKIFSKWQRNGSQVEIGYLFDFKESGEELDQDASFAATYTYRNYVYSKALYNFIFTGTKENEMLRLRPDPFLCKERIIEAANR